MSTGLPGDSLPFSGDCSTSGCPSNTQAEAGHCLSVLIYMGLVLAAAHRVIMSTTHRAILLAAGQQDRGPRNVNSKRLFQFAYGGETTLSEFKTMIHTKPLGYAIGSRHFLVPGSLLPVRCMGFPCCCLDSLCLYEQCRVSWQGCELCSFPCFLSLSSFVTELMIPKQVGQYP